MNKEKENIHMSETLQDSMRRDWESLSRVDQLYCLSYAGAVLTYPEVSRAATYKIIELYNKYPNIDLLKVIPSLRGWDD